MRSLAPALLCALLPMAAAAAAERPALDVEGWTYVGASATSVMFIRHEATPEGGAYPRVLVRFEEAKPFDRRGFASMSSVEIDEIDCAGQRTRVIQDTRYKQSNLKGESRVDRAQAPAWQDEAKGSFGAGILKAACADPETPRA